MVRQDGVGAGVAAKFEGWLGSRGASMLAAAALAVFVAVLLFRTGRVPIASGGDDVWFSESAYWLLQDGVLRRPMHPNALMAGLRDFLPPIPSLGQAAAFLALGMTPFAMAIMPTLLMIALTAMLWRFLRQRGFPPLLAACAAFTPLASHEAMVRAYQVRYDIYAAFFAVAAILSLHRARAGGGALAYALGGLCAGLAVVSYYPFVFFPAILLVLLLKWLVDGSIGKARVAAFVGGGLIVAGAFLLWIGRDLTWFLAYNLQAGKGYESGSKLVKMLRLQELPPFWLVAMATLAIYVLVKGLRARRWSGELAATVAAVVLAGQAGMLGVSHALLTPTAYLSMVALGLALEEEGGARAPAPLAAALVLAGAAAFAGVATTAALAVQPGRRFEPFAAQLRAAVNPQDLVVVDNPGWLPLRRELPRDKLVHNIGYSNDASMVDTPTWYYDADAAKKISTLAIVPGQERRLDTAVALKAFIASPDVVGPILIGAAMPYQLNLYRREPFTPPMR